MLEFSKEVSKWMAQDDENIVAIHCKGGKGKIIFLFISLFLKKCEKYIKIKILHFWWAIKQFFFLNIEFQENTIL